MLVPVEDVYLRGSNFLLGTGACIFVWLFFFWNVGWLFFPLGNVQIDREALCLSFRVVFSLSR